MAAHCEGCDRGQRPQTRPMSHDNKHLEVKMTHQGHTTAQLCDSSPFSFSFLLLFCLFGLVLAFSFKFCFALGGMLQRWRVDEGGKKGRWVGLGMHDSEIQKEPIKAFFKKSYEFERNWGRPGVESTA